MPTSLKMVSFVLTIFLTVFASSNADYIAAVVERFPLNATSPNQTLQTNLQEYLYHIEAAKSYNVQIIVFPEYGLTGLIDDPKDYAIEIPAVGFGPIYQNEILQGLANAAAEHLMYIVVNLAEKALDSKNKTIYYNTNIVFDKERKIVAKYRKINLFEEPFFTAGNSDENKQVVFATDFGISFGLFICFDVAFYTPSRTVLNTTEKVTNIVYPTAWYSQLPFYHSLSFHQGYAMENKVNFLVANINNVNEGQGGSGIFGSDGTVYSYYISGKNSSKLLIGHVKTGSMLKAIPNFNTDEVLIEDPTSELVNFKTTRLFESSKYSMKQIDVSQAVNSTQTICDGAYCCTFNYNITSPNNSSVYYIMAYRGPSKLGPSVTDQIKVCLLLACETSDKSTCGTRNVTQTVKFEKLSVTSEVPDLPETYNIPYSLTTGLLPVFNTSHSQSTENGTKYISLTTRKAEDKILVFGIYGNGATSLTVSSAMLALLVIFKYLFV